MAEFASSAMWKKTLSRNGAGLGPFQAWGKAAKPSWLTSGSCAAMTISIDSNVIAALWNNGDPLNAVALQLLRNYRAHEKLVVSGAVYSELMARPVRDE